MTTRSARRGRRREPIRHRRDAGGGGGSSRAAPRRFQIADQFTDKIALEEYESFLGRIVEQVVPEEPEEEPVPRRSSIDSLISHLRNEEVEEIVTDVFEEMSYEVWVSNLGAVLTTIAKDEKPVEEIFVSITPRKLRTRVEVIVAKANTEGTAGSMEEKFLDLSYYAIQIQRVMRGKRGRRRWKDRLARWVRRSQDLLTSALRAQSTRRGILGRRAADEERNRQDELLRKAREARELRKLRELSALKIQCYHRRARAIQLLLRMRRLAQAKAGPVVCDLAELETFFDEEPIVPVQSVMPVFSFTLLPPEIKIPVVVQEPAFDHEAERLRILEEMRRAEEALELDRKAAARAAAEAARENERRAKERLRIALEAFTTGRSQKIVNRFLIKYVIEPYRWRKEQERWKANRAKRARPSIFRGGYWSDLSDEEEPDVEEVVEAGPKKEMPCAQCGGRVVCVCAEERYRRKELLRRKKLRPTDAEKEEAFRQKAAYSKKDLTYERAGELVEMQLTNIEAKFGSSNKTKKGVLSLPHIVGAEDPPEDSLMKFFASRDGPPSAGDQWYTLENVKEQQSRSDRFKRNMATSRRLKQETGEIELSVRDKMIYRTLTAPVLPPRPWSSQIDDHGRAPSYKRAMTSGSMVPLDGSGRWSRCCVIY